MQFFTKNKNTTLLFALTVSFVAANKMTAQDKTLVTIQGEKLTTVSDKLTAGSAEDVASTLYVTGLITDLATTTGADKLDKVLNENLIFVGNGANVATGVPMSGEARIDSTGKVTLENDDVIAKTLAGFTSAAGTITNADSVLSAIEKLDANVAAVVAGGVTSVDANILAATGTVPTLTVDNTNTNAPVIGLEIPNAVDPGVTAGLISKVDYEKFDSKLTSTLNDNLIFIGNGSNVATAVAVTGEVILTNTGIITLENDAVIAKTLAGFTSAPGTISNADSVLSAIQKLDANITAATTSHVSEKFTAGANQTLFPLASSATSIFSFYINGQKVPVEAISAVTNNVTYDPTKNNGTYNLKVGDVITIQYFK